MQLLGEKCGPGKKKPALSTGIKVRESYIVLTALLSKKTRKKFCKTGFNYAFTLPILLTYCF